MQSQDKLINYLRSFADLSVASIDEFKAHLSIKQIKKETIYFDKHTYSKKLGFLSEGVMRIYDIDSPSYLRFR